MLVVSLLALLSVPGLARTSPTPASTVSPAATASPAATPSASAATPSPTAAALTAAQQYPLIAAAASFSLHFINAISWPFVVLGIAVILRKQLSEVLTELVEAMREHGFALPVAGINLQVTERVIEVPEGSTLLFSGSPFGSIPSPWSSVLPS